MGKWVFLNNEFVQEEKAALHFRDLSIQRGYGIFDFFKVVNGIPVFLSAHVNRFYFSAAQMRLRVRYSMEELQTIIQQLLQKNDMPHTGVRITLTGGYSADGYQLSEPNLLISAHPFTPPSKEQMEKGISLITHLHQRQLPQVKTIDYLMAIWLQPLIKEKKADDVLYYQNTVISECPRSNLFMVTKENKIITPAKNILKGIVRMKVMDLAKKWFEVEERDISLDEIKTAKEVFITSTTKSILPVARINEHSFDKSFTIAAQLLSSLKELEASDCSIKDRTP